MTDHLALVDAARGLVPAHIAWKQTLFVDFSAQFSVQCLRLVRSLSIVAIVLRIQRLRLRLSVTVAVVSEAEAMSTSAAMNMKVRKPEPAEIEYKNMRFLITYRPTDATMDRFIEVSSLVASCS